MPAASRITCAIAILGRSLSSAQLQGTDATTSVSVLGQNCTADPMIRGGIRCPYDRLGRHGYWYDHVLVLWRQKLLFCGISKNGLTLLNQVAARVQRIPFKWFKLAPVQEREREKALPFATFVELLTNSSSGWGKFVVYRDPLQRFLSAYRSKCLLADSDGRKHCHQHFNLAQSQMSPLEVARRLPHKGMLNAHWAPQSVFCGQTVGKLWQHYTHIAFQNLSNGILAAYEGRVSEQVYLDMTHRLRRPSDPSHITNTSERAALALPDEVKQLVMKYYEADYRMLNLKPLL
jgi:hypothetical protein